MADTMPFPLLANADTQPISIPASWDSFDPVDDQWFDEGERRAEQEWSEVTEAGRSCPRVSLAFAVAGSVALSFLLANAF